VTQPRLSTFEFDVVTVDAQGQETHRTRGQAQFFTEDLGIGVGLDMVLVPGGAFVMGGPQREAKSSYEEEPQHPVTVPPFFMGKYAVTQEQWCAVSEWPKVNHDLDPNGSHFKGVKRPVEKVTWYGAVEFCERLSRKTGQEYRLPSEAEWEYACRAGTTTPFHFGETLTTDLANYCGSDFHKELGWSGTYGQGPEGVFQDQTTDVGSFPPNAFGLYDMHGNVSEWCLDHCHNNYQGAPTNGSAWVTGGYSDYRVFRGGLWLSPPRYCRSAYRSWTRPDYAHYGLGFRVVCTAA